MSKVDERSALRQLHHDRSVVRPGILKDRGQDYERTCNLEHRRGSHGSAMADHLTLMNFVGNPRGSWSSDSTHCSKCLQYAQALSPPGAMVWVGGLTPFVG